MSLNNYIIYNIVIKNVRLRTQRDIQSAQT